jgi:heptosyltransferase I
MREPRRIAIIKPSALGDIVHALPVLSALRGHYPNSHITWVVNRGFEPLLVGHPHLDATLPFDRGAFRSVLGGAHAAWQFANTLRRQNFDLVLDLQGLLRTGLMTAATAAPVKLGFANAREGAARFYTHRVEVPDADRIHAVDRYWRMVERLGISSVEKQFQVPVRDSEREAAKRELSPFPRPWVAVAAGAKWITKRWPPKRFAELLTRTHQEFGGSVVLLGSAEDRLLSEEIAREVPQPVLDLTGKTTLPKLTAVLALAEVMLANDTGPLHLAAALGCPCVAPYTCTRVQLHGPYSAGSHGVEAPVACQGSYVKQCPRGMICFEQLTASDLWPAMIAVLSRGNTLERM